MIKSALNSAYSVVPNLKFLLPMLHILTPKRRTRSPCTADILLHYMADYERHFLFANERRDKVLTKYVAETSSRLFPTSWPYYVQPSRMS